MQKICSVDGVEVIPFVDYKKAQKAKDLDLLFVNTIQPYTGDYIKWTRFKPKCKTILTIHEAESELNNFFPFRKKVIDKFDAISVSLPSVKKYIQQHDLYDKEIYTIPFALHKEKTSTNGFYVVSGQIAKHRRDYLWLLHPEVVHDYLPLWIVGSPVGSYGKEIVRIIKGYANEGLPICWTINNDYVPKEEYERAIKYCSTILAPLREPTDGFLGFKKEHYGVTKACGAMFEAIKYGKKFESNLDISLDYKDYILEDWQQYFKNKFM